VLKISLQSTHGEFMGRDTHGVLTEYSRGTHGVRPARLLVALAKVAAILEVLVSADAVVDVRLRSVTAL
jgi:hypothetical protein